MLLQAQLLAAKPDVFPGGPVLTASSRASFKYTYHWQIEELRITGLDPSSTNQARGKGSQDCLFRHGVGGLSESRIHLMIFKDPAAAGR